jgi:hypothetical protein
MPTVTSGHPLPPITVLDADGAAVDLASLAGPGRALVIVAIRYYG